MPVRLYVYIFLLSFFVCACIFCSFLSWIICFCFLLLSYSPTQIQAALPSGARLRARGRFDGSMIQPWVTFVQEATTALELMEAWLLLESSLNPRWLESPSKR